MREKIDIGTSNFRVVSQSDYYVDKTKMLVPLVQRSQSGSSLIINRPRRFGKSLAISMIETFFSDSIEHAEQYFQGLYIASTNSMDAISSFPVIRLSFNDVVDTGDFDVKTYLKRLIANVYESFKPCVFPTLTEQERKDYESIISLGADDIASHRALKELTRYLARAKGKKPIVLIDEYDSILEKRGPADPGIVFFKAMLTALLKDNDNLGMGILTGVFSLAKGSLGSGLNNIPIDNGLAEILDENYFGFNEAEVLSLLHKYGFPNESLKALKEYYGGYRFYRGYYFNPWSIVNYLNSGIITGYWIDSARQSAFDSLLDFAVNGSKPLIDHLIEGKPIIGKFDFTISYEDVSKTIENTLLYLTMAGYLTICQIGFNDFSISIPNKETLSMFRRLYLVHYRDRVGLGKAYDIRNAFLGGDSERLAQLLHDFILSAMSYYDFNDEKNYQIMIGTIAGMLFDESIVKFEVIAGKGRCDLMISPLVKNQFGAVIEVKYYGSRQSATRLHEGASTALRQIKENDYLEELRIRGASPLYAYGIAFCKNNVDIVCEQIK
ncbi:MAG: AAA family ATPase [Bacilli bacterium]|nr:AAA family ATPase [Bacilli bacterium]